MKGLSAGLTFLNVSTVSAVLLGLAAAGLGPSTAALSLAIGFGAAVIAYFTTHEPDRKWKPRVRRQSEPKLSKRAQRRLEKTAQETEPAPPSPADPRRYQSVWFWLLALCFAVFAVRSFCWLLYVDGPELKI